MADENYDYSFNILHEVVAPNDLFPDKTHEKVAQNLYELIQSSDRGVTIGLEGGWGSGKSTVVNLLKEKLAEKDKEGERTLFFLFDTWAHDGDPLRRIFLESLINEIDPKNIDKTLNNLQQKISGRKKTVEIKTKKSASTLGKCLSFSAIFVPVGAAILSAINYQTLSLFNFTEEPHWPFIIGVTLALTPLWIISFWWLCSKKDEKGKTRWEFFVSDSEESYTQDITEDGERTSIEFESFFRQIMNYSIGDGKKFKQALLVVDNLDRVEPDQALSIWSILQTFFQYRNKPDLKNGSAWISKLWFLVPYDREGLSQVWSKKDHSIVINTTESAAEKSASFPSSKNGPQEGLAPSFLEKCFQIIAEVPEPVMSAWVEYAESTIKKALVGWPPSKLDKIISTYKSFESRLESSPTPRQIQAFANRVGMLGMRWHDEMSAEAIALYALVRKNRSDKQLRKELLNDGLPDNYDGAADNYDLKKQIAGMLFGVEKEKGIELLLKPAINDALINGDSKTLQSIIENHGEAFWIVWQAIRGGSLPRGHVEDYRIAVTKAFCEATNNHKERVSVDIKNLISEWKNSEEKWKLDEYDYSEALAALFKITRSKDELNELLTWLKTKVQKSINESVSHLGNEKFKTSTLYNISALINLLLGYEQTIKIIRPKELDQNKWKIWLEGMEYEGVNIKCVLPAKGTIKNLSETIHLTNPDINLIEILISTLPFLPQDEEWELVVDSINTFATNPNHATGKNKIYELMVWIYTSCRQKAKEKIKAIVKNATFISKAQNETIDSVPALLALPALIYQRELLDSDTAQNIKNFWQAEYNPEKCKPLISLLKEVGSLSAIWLLATDPNNKLAIGFIRSLEEESIYQSPLGVKYFDEYEWASDEELADILSKSIKHGGLSKAKNDLIQDPVTYRHCLKLIRQHGGYEGTGVVEEALKNTSSEQWKKALVEDTVLFDCIESQGNHEFKEAAQSIFLEELGGIKLTHHLWEQFSKIYEKIMDKKDVAGSIAEKYFSLDTDPLNNQEFEQLSPKISEFISKVNPSNLMTRVDSWLADNQWARIEWLLDAGLEFDITPKESLASRVTALLDDGDEKNQSTLMAIVKMFNIQIGSPDDNDEEVVPD